MTGKVYLDGFKLKGKNKRISLTEKEDGVFLTFQILTENADQPSCSHSCFKGKIRKTELSLSKESFEALVYAYLAYIK